MSSEMERRVAELETETQRLGITEIPHYTDEQRARLIVEVFQQHEHSTDPEIRWRLQRITEILETARRRKNEGLSEAH